MRKPNLALSMVAVCLGAGGAWGETKLPDGTAVGAPLSKGHLTLVPLLASAPPAPGEATAYLTLDEGMDKGLVKIIERGNGGSVNELVVSNQSDRPLFVMSGEVILGGQQDRIIGKDTVIPARKRQEVPVFCVEHGRWNGKDKSFRTAKAMAHTKLRKQASYAGQGEVWDEVAKKNKARGESNATDTYRRVATEKGTAAAVKPYAEALGGALAALPERDRVVGVAVAVNGEVVAIEQFASPALWGKVQEKILRSYFVEAVDVPAAKEPRPLRADDVVAFARAEESAAAETVLDAAERKTERLSGKGVKGTKVVEKDAPAKPVYKSLHKD
jgi:hypothetical protein